MEGLPFTREYALSLGPAFVSHTSFVAALQALLYSFFRDGWVCYARYGKTAVEDEPSNM